MIIYGIVFENVYKDQDLLDRIEEYAPDDRHTQVILVTGYSVGPYEPEAAVFGIILDHTCFLFNPTAISDINALEPTQAQQLDLEQAMKDLGLEGEPKVYIFDESDD